MHTHAHTYTYTKREKKKTVKWMQTYKPMIRGEVITIIVGSRLHIGMNIIYRKMFFLKNTMKRKKK